MILICDYCSVGKSKIFKVSSSAFYIKDFSLIVMKDYINLCSECLMQNEKEQEE